MPSTFVNFNFFPVLPVYLFISGFSPGIGENFLNDGIYEIINSDGFLWLMAIFFVFVFVLLDHNKPRWKDHPGSIMHGKEYSLNFIFIYRTEIHKISVLAPGFFINLLWQFLLCADG